VFCNKGNISTVGPLDRETAGSYVLAVRARDGRVPERTAFAAVGPTIQLLLSLAYWYMFYIDNNCRIICSD